MIFSFASIITLGSLVGGGTYAFLATTPSVTQGFIADSGTVDLAGVQGQGKTAPGPMFYTAMSYPAGPYPYDIPKSNPNQPLGGEAIGRWAPGDTVIRSMKLANSGTLSLKVNMLKATLNRNRPGTTSGPAYEEFIDKMKMKVVYSSKNSQLYNGSLRGLLNGWTEIPPIIAPVGSDPHLVTFEAYLDKSTGNFVQGKDFIFDFSFQGRQFGDECFLPPFSNRNFSFKPGSTVPIKFNLMDEHGDIDGTQHNDVRLVITGPGVKGGTVNYQFTQRNGTLSFNDKQYHAQFTSDYPVVTGGKYTATVYVGDEVQCEKEFMVEEDGNRSNSPNGK